MIKIENVVLPSAEQWRAVILGARNAMNSWDKSDSKFVEEENFDPNDYPCGFKLGPNDYDLLRRLAAGGSTHAKYRRMITVYADITGPLYWWKEADTYRMGVEKNSCSTMHKIAAKEFTLEDFSCEHLYQETYDLFRLTIDHLNKLRDIYLNGGVLRVGVAPAWFDAKDKEIWWNMIQLLPSSYNQKRTVMLNYEVLSHIYKDRKNHKLDEWSEHKKKQIDVTTTDDILNNDYPKYADGFEYEYFGFCDWIKTLPYHELITLEEE